jgi:hypothetical protein
MNGFNLTEYTSFELETLLTAIRLRLTYLRDNFNNKIEIATLEQFRTKVLEAKISVLNEERTVSN